MKSKGSLAIAAVLFQINNEKVQAPIFVPLLPTTITVPVTLSMTGEVIGKEKTFEFTSPPVKQGNSLPINFEFVWPSNPQ